MIHLEIKKLTLRQARRLAEISQGQAAKLLNVSLHTILNWEKGYTVPDVTMMDKIEDVYGVPKDMIIFVGEKE